MTEKTYISKWQDISARTGNHHIGDDAAIIAPSTIISTDQFIESVHFEWSQMSAEKIGYKAITQALSDLAAMSAKPTGILCSLAWNNTHTIYLEGFMKGVESACLDYKVPLVGGDITKSPAHFYADIVVTGSTTTPATKHKARINDIILVSGTMGDARAGWECSLNKITSYPLLVEKFQSPKALIDSALQLSHSQHLLALTDISDSLSKSLFSIAEHSQVGMLIDEDKIPTSIELKKYVIEKTLNLNDYKWNSGEDYQLLAVVSPELPEEFYKQLGFTAIGRVTKGDQIFFSREGKTQSLTEVGWDPFRL